MGIIWRFAMPLLSTLAALVIIVHSAEEDLDHEYRYDLRSRALNTETASYEQPWRVVKPEPVVKHAERDVWSQDSHEEQPKRRRKRKRRPIETSDEDLATQERYTYPESHMKMNEHPEYDNAYQTTEIPRRRRKRINGRTNRWADEAIEAERPIRRRGNRRNRPSLETWPKLSEFSLHHRDDDNKPESEETTPKQEFTNDSDEDPNETAEPGGYVEYSEPMNAEPESDAVLKEVYLPIPNVKSYDKKQGKNIMSKNRTLSEFSMETLPSYHESETSDNINTQVHEIEKQRGDRYVSPSTLKDILKRSNGRSLSEILQQHNLTLTDLLRGKEDAIKILKSENTLARRKDIGSMAVTDSSEETKQPTEIEAFESKNPLSVNSKYEANTENITNTDSSQGVRLEENKEIIKNTFERTEKEIDTEQNYKNKTNSMIFSNRRRFPTGLRKKLRLRPMVNNTFKSPLSRDVAALGLKRFPNRRNITKSQEWKNMIPLLVTTPPNTETNISKNYTESQISTTTISTTIPVTFEDTTIVIDFDKPDREVVIIDEKPSNVSKNYIEISSTEIPEVSVTTTDSPTTVHNDNSTVHFNLAEKPIVMPTPKQLNITNIRTPFNNRIKKKRLKQKPLSTVAPENEVIKNMFVMGNLASSSEVRATTAKKLFFDEESDVDALEDFMTTAKSRQTESNTMPSKLPSSSIRPSTTTKFISAWIPSEETAEIEIKELLNDTRTSARLSKILMERNMTLNELVEHRERGSSHVHLADIFHNASREPNPPEPFLSKSLIEPISKETYPLRALLDASSHEPSVKATTIDSTYSQANSIQNIPVVMDFGNNVNENAENMGIMSLFNNFTNSVRSQPTSVQSSVNMTKTSIVNTTVIDSNRESRVLNDNQDMVSWNDIFSMIRKGHNNETEQKVEEESYKQDMSPSATYKRISLEEDVDGDGVIVLEDLQHLRDFDSNIASDEKLEIYEREGPSKPGILNVPGNTKSVTVATASIVGLSMVLFLLTYAAFKWIQQKKKENKRKFPSERIPTPVFENRKGHKNNSSTRSISPMLSSSNIYTMNTLESQHRNDSPEYMWDTLRKPFQ